METIKEHNGYVYWWSLSDYLKPSETGTMSDKRYTQSDCVVNRYRHLSFVRYKQPMSGGSGKTYNPPNPDWQYPTTDSIGGGLLNYVCDYVD